MTMRAYEGRCHVCGRDDFPDLIKTTEEIDVLTKQRDLLKLYIGLFCKKMQGSGLVHTAVVIDYLEKALLAAEELE